MNKEFSNETLKQKRLSKAVSVGAELFLERGIANVKMTDVAEESGIGVATLYRYFGTKTNLVIASATFLWNDIRRLFSSVFESDDFRKQSGLKQLTDLLRMFAVLYTEHAGFLKFLGEFDLLLLQESVPKSALVEYEASLLDYYPICEEAYHRGCHDGSVREGLDFKLVYVTYAHALTQLGEKFTRGELLPGDDFSTAENELEMLITTAEYYLARN